MNKWKTQIETPPQAEKSLLTLAESAATQLFRAMTAW